MVSLMGQEWCAPMTVTRSSTGTSCWESICDSGHLRFYRANWLVSTRCCCQQWSLCFCDDCSSDFESGYGSSALSNAPYYNLFGVKGSYNGQSVYMPTQEYLNGQWVEMNEPFRQYNSYWESFQDHANVLRSTSFATGLLITVVFGKPNNLVLWCNELLDWALCYRSGKKTELVNWNVSAHALILGQRKYRMDKYNEHD